LNLGKCRCVKPLKLKGGGGRIFEDGLLKDVVYNRLVYSLFKKLSVASGYRHQLPSWRDRLIGYGNQLTGYTDLLLTGYKISCQEKETSFPDTETSSLDTESIAHWKRRLAPDVEAGFSDMKTSFPDEELRKWRPAPRIRNQLPGYGNQLPVFGDQLLG
jgi:hypothetical protein